MRRGEAGEKLRELVQREGALTFDQLNWLEWEEDDRQTAATYRHSAHLFVRELLRLRGGADCISTMLAALPEHLNWQTAFLRAFTPHFQRMLDVEKWWALNLVQWRTRDSVLAWSAAEASTKLAEILFAPVQVPTAPGEPPRISAVPLQTVVRDWPMEEQLALLNARLAQLQTARLRWPGPFATLAESYRLTIEKYLQSRGARADAPGRSAVQRAVSELDTLDAQRAQLPGKTLATRSLPVPPLTPP
jgi:hypothetical protein